MASSGLPGQKITQNVYYSTDTSNTVVPTSWTLLGGVSSSTGLGVTRATSDATTDDWAEKVVTQLSQDGSVNGFYKTQTSSEQHPLRDYIEDDTNEQTCGWLRFDIPRESTTEKMYLPVIFTAMTIDATVGEVSTFELSYESNGRRQREVV